MYKIYFHITPSLEIYSNILDEPQPVETAEPITDEHLYSPLRPFIKSSIDLNSALIRNPSATYFGRVKNKSFEHEGIGEGDLLIIDQSLEPIDGAMALCLIGDDYTVRLIAKDKDMVSWLVQAEGSADPVKVTPKNLHMIKGTVVYIIKKV